MTDAINIKAPFVAQHQAALSNGDVQRAVLEAPALDPETRSRLLQLGLWARSVRSALATQMILSSQLAEEGLGTLGPPHTEILNDAIAFDELKRKQQKESELASALGHTLHTSSRAQTDMFRAFSFLMPQIMLEEEGEVSLPGFQSPMKNPADLDMSGLIWNSHADFFAQISALLEVLKTEWLSKYQDALAKFLEFYQKFSDIMEKIKFQASGDKGDVTCDFTKVREELDKLLSEYSLTSSALASFSSEEAAMAFKDSLGLPGLGVVQDGDGSWKVTMDTSALKDILNDMPGGSVKWDSARYNSWISAKDSNMEQIKHVSKVLGEKLNEMTQKFDNIVKILSSSIDKMSEANNAYVHNT